MKAPWDTRVSYDVQCVTPVLTTFQVLLKMLSPKPVSPRRAKINQLREKITRLNTEKQRCLKSQKILSYAQIKYHFVSLSRVAIIMTQVIDRLHLCACLPIRQEIEIATAKVEELKKVSVVDEVKVGFVSLRYFM